MNSKFRETHLIHLLQGFSHQNLPLDVYIRNYFKSNKAIGSHDRKFLAETIYTMFRWLGLVDHYCDKNHNWENRFKVFKTLDFSQTSSFESLPPNISVSFPKNLFELIEENYGLSKAREFCLTSNTQAPTTIRVNVLKISRDSLYQKWKDKYKISLCSQSSVGIIFEKRENFFGMPEFKEGFFEVQDEGSQLISFLVQAKPGQQVMDYCSGSGGKSLAFAPLMQSTGQIYLHDIRPHALQEAKKRLRRAGIQNAQILNFDDPKKSKLKNSMDWVLVDGPCSGSGTYRRNPDMKWRFDISAFQSMILDQRQIFKEALQFVKPGGKIIYSTCSILKQENENQVDFFLKNLPVKLLGNPLNIFPVMRGMDGFYGATFEKAPL